MRRMQYSVALAPLAICCIVGTAEAQSNAGTPQNSTQLPDVTGPARPGTRKDVRCEHDGHTGDRAGSELKCLLKIGDLAVRDGDILNLKLLNNKTKTYKSTFKACEDGDAEHCVAYRLAGYFPVQEMILVDAGTYEGGHWRLVSRLTGSEIELPAPPYFSPDGRKLVSVSASEAGGENGIDIWSVTSDPLLEWRYRVPDDAYAMYQFARWQGNDRVKMNVSLWVGKEMKSLPAEVARIDGKWQLFTPTPRPSPR